MTNSLSRKKRSELPRCIEVLVVDVESWLSVGSFGGCRFSLRLVVEGVADCETLYPFSGVDWLFFKSAGVAISRARLCCCGW